MDCNSKSREEEVAGVLRYDAMMERKERGEEGKRKHKDGNKVKVKQFSVHRSCPAT